MSYNYNNLVGSNVAFCENNGDGLVIYSNGNIKIIGTIKNAALALVNYIFHEFDRELVTLTINNSIQVKFENNIIVSCLGPNKPEWFDEFTEEFNKIIELKAFI